MVSDGERCERAMRTASRLMFAALIPCVIVAFGLFAWMFALALGVR